MKQSISICWLRRDLRLDDNAALYHALRADHPVLILFIFDTTILEQLSDPFDKRVLFIHHTLAALRLQLADIGSTIRIEVGTPQQIWARLIVEYDVQAVFANHDFEPYAKNRDAEIKALLAANQVPFYTYKDHVIFEKNEVLKDDGKPYTVFTPYSRKWKSALKQFYYKSYPSAQLLTNLLRTHYPFDLPCLSSFGFQDSSFEFPPSVAKSDIIKRYSEQRDIPSIEGTSHLGIHLRFGTLSIRKLLAFALERNETFVNELIWRDFYQQILWHFPQVVGRAFRQEYDHIEWINDESQFQRWCTGHTGYPMVDAGMRELNATGYMHNRVRMLTASFLSKHLLIDWRWGEAYFAKKLLDFDLAANNGGWQWAAGCGTDAAPYFRIFSPSAQHQRFDPKSIYVRRWVPEFESLTYEAPIVDHDLARKRCLDAYKKALSPSQ